MMQLLSFFTTKDHHHYHLFHEHRRL